MATIAFFVCSSLLKKSITLLGVLPTLATNQVVRMLCVSEQSRPLQDELEDLADFASIALPRPGAAWELAPLGLY